MARHVFPMKPRWSDLDAYNHVNNVTWLEYLQEARVDMLFVHAGDRGAERLAEGVVVVRAEIDYRRPMVFRQEPYPIEMWVRVSVAAPSLSVMRSWTVVPPRLRWCTAPHRRCWRPWTCPPAGPGA